jgi:hypothetical protein
MSTTDQTASATGKGSVRCPRCTGVVVVPADLFAEHNRTVHGSAVGR